MASGSYYVYPTPMGRVTLVAVDGKLVQAHFGSVELPFACKADSVTNAAASQLQEYLAGKRQRFDVALAPSGSCFQKDVWEAIARIPYGQTATAAQIAEALGKPQSFRSVGAAVHANPLPMFIPCHRVVESSGKPGTYPHGPKIKEFLLNLEKHGALD